MRAGFLLTMVAACAALVVPAAAEATYPGKNGNIAVVEVDTGMAGFGSDLSLLRSNGKVLKGSLQSCSVFTGDPKQGFCAQSQNFSRDGSKLVFSIDSSADKTFFAPATRLVVANADGSARTVLPALTEADSDPAWTRGRKLLFTGMRGGKRNLYIVKSDGTGLRQITHNVGRAGAYSNRGLIAYVAKGYVRLLRPGGKSRRLASGDNPDFSPSGKTVVYDRPRGKDSRGFDATSVFRKSIKRGATRRRLAKDGEDPVFSPSGKRVLYVRGELEFSRYALITETPRAKRRKRIFRAADLDPSESYLAGPAWQPRR